MMNNMMVMDSAAMGFDTKMLRANFKFKKDQWFGFYSSLAFHILILFIIGISFVKPIEFGVDTGLSAMDVQLVAGSDEPIVPVEEVVEEISPIEMPVIQEEKIVIPESVKEIPKPIENTNLGNSAVDASSVDQGALTVAKPDYLQNPAPSYPYKARQNAWEGIVFLTVSVNSSGYPTKVNVEKTSGYDILDEAAIKTIKTWRFKPAKIGSLAVESSVQIPIRFRLEDY